jgi:sulfur carrier protein ThiS
MKMSIQEIEVKEDKTIKELMDELQLSTAPILLMVGGRIFYPDAIKDRRLRKGARVTLIPLIAGG